MKRFCKLFAGDDRRLSWYVMHIMACSRKHWYHRPDQQPRFAPLQWSWRVSSLTLAARSRLITVHIQAAHSSPNVRYPKRPFNRLRVTSLTTETQESQYLSVEPIECDPGEGAVENEVHARCIWAQWRRRLQRTQPPGASWDVLWPSVARSDEPVRRSELAVASFTPTLLVCAQQ